MRFYERLTIVLVGLTLVSACLKPPARVNFKEKKTDDVVDGTNPGEDGSGEMEVDHMNQTVIDPKDTSDAVGAVLADKMPECDAKPSSPGRPVLRLLTRYEFANSLKDVLGLTRDASGLIPSESNVGGFINNVDVNLVSLPHAEAFTEIAITVADEIKPNLQSLVNCSEDAGESCAQKVISALAPKLYRRPLTAAESAQALVLYKKGAAFSPREGMTLLISSLIASPNFLYRPEIGDGTGNLTSYEIASSLSYFFWGTVPDAQLLSLAASNKLLEDATLLSEAERLWKDKKSRYISDQFSRGWLDSLKVKQVLKDAALSQTFTQPIKDAMSKEIEDTFAYLFTQPTATFESLFNNDFTIGSQELASYYKAQIVSENGVNKIKYPNTPRKGLVTLGGVMASHASASETNPITRGAFVLTNMLCFVPPPTPKGLTVMIPEKNATQTTRERFAVHSGNPMCASCHLKIDGIGFGMEDYDTGGQFRSMDNGKLVDASGTVVGFDGKDTKFSGAGEMSEALGASNTAKRCFSLQWYRLAHGRSLSITDPDVCAARNLSVQFSKGEIPMSALLVKILTDSSYKKRGK